MFSNLNKLTLVFCYSYLILEYLLKTITYPTFFKYFPYLSNLYFETIFPYFSFYRINCQIFLFIFFLHILICLLLVIINIICNRDDYQNTNVKYDNQIFYFYFTVIIFFILYFFKLISLKFLALYILFLTFFVILY